MASKTKAGAVRRGKTAEQQIDPLTQEVIVAASDLLSGGVNPFAAMETPSGLDEHAPYLEALEKYREAGRALAHVAMENVLRNYEDDE